MKLAAALLASALALSAHAQTPAAAAASGPAALPGPTPSEDLGTTVPSADAISEGLFPDDKCQELIRAGFKCMGFKPATKYSLPASSFKIGSAELPALLKQQLAVFAQVLKGRKDNSRQVRIIGHADASGTDRANLALSVKRAESVRDYLTGHGVDPALLVTEGVGSNDLKNPAKPKADENRRVEIGRQGQP